MIEAQVTRELPDVTPAMLRRVERGLNSIRKEGLDRVYNEAPVGRGKGWYTKGGKQGGHMRDDDLQAKRSGLEVTFYGKFRARFVNDGTGAHVIKVRYRDKRGRNRKRKVFHPGARANPFFERVLYSAEWERYAVAILDRQVSEVL